MIAASAIHPSRVFFLTTVSLITKMHTKQQLILTTPSPLLLPHHKYLEEVAMKIDIEQVKSYIDENLNQLRKSQQVAAHLNCSVEGLKRSFLKTECLSLSSYIRATKIARMKQELQNTENPCKVICLDLGLREDVGARLFKNVTGMTMESYRRICRHDIPQTNHTVCSRNDRKRPEPGLILTEGVIRKVLASSESLSKVTAKHSTGILIQGPAN